MHSLIKLAVTVVTLGGLGYGGYKLYGKCKQAYDNDVQNLKQEIQNVIDNIHALSVERGELLNADRIAVIQQARVQLLKTEPDIETLYSVLSILNDILNNMLQHR